jgi:phage terminase small subunit
MASDRPLTEKQLRFAELVASGKSLTDAYVGAYQSKGSRANAGKEGAALVKRANVAAHIAKLKVAVQEKLKEKAATAKDVEAATIDASSEAIAIEKSWVMAKLVTVVEQAMEAQPIVNKKGEEVGYTNQLNAANRALELLGKEMGMFIDRKMNVPADPLDGLTTAELRELLKVVDGDPKPQPGPGRTTH